MQTRIEMLNTIQLIAVHMRGNIWLGSGELSKKKLILASADGWNR
jgi:hypothetical protein